MFVEQKEYDSIMKVMPIPCVDIMLFLQYTKEILILKRNQEPGKDTWWTPGGRIWKGETVSQAGKRKMQEEAGITDCTYYGISGAVEFFENQYHTISVILVANIKKRPKIKLDKNFSDFIWATPEALINSYSCSMPIHYCAVKIITIGNNFYRRLKF